MSTVREEYDLTCPSCNQDDELDIWATVAVRVTANGADPSEAEDGATEWDNESLCQCAACGWSGTVGEAERAARGEQPEHVTIKIHFSMEHRAAQQSPTGEIARIMQSITANMESGILPEWSEIEDPDGHKIGEFECQVRALG